VNVFVGRDSSKCKSTFSHVLLPERKLPATAFALKTLNGTAEEFSALNGADVKLSTSLDLLCQTTTGTVLNILVLPYSFYILSSKHGIIVFVSEHLRTPVVIRVTTLWVKRPLSVNQHGQLSQPSLRGRLNVSII